MNKRRAVWLVMLFAFAGIIAFAGCGGGAGGGGASDNAPAALITTDPASGPEANATLDTTEPAPPALQAGQPFTQAASTPGTPPPDGASADGTFNTNYAPSKAFDGVLNSWWVGTPALGAWNLYYGFTATRHIDQIGINFYSTSHMPSSVVLKTSVDGLTWNTVGTFAAGKTNPWLPVNADIRYIWIEMTGNPSIGYPLIREVLWTPDLVRTPSGGPGMNEYTYKAANAFDNDPNTWWVGKQDAGAWDLYYDYGSVSHLQMLTFVFYNINYAPATTKLLISKDGATWTDAGDAGPGANTTPYKKYLACNCDARYLHIQMTGNPATKYPIIKDILFGFPDGASSGDSFNTYYHAGNAADGNLNTWWTGKPGATEWNLFYKFAVPQGIGDVIINYYAATHAPAATLLYKSNDGNTWKLVGQFPAGASPMLGVASASTQYLRFLMQGAPTVGYPLIKDITITPGTGAWSRKYGTTTITEEARAIRQTTDNNYVACIRHTAGGHFHINKLDANGNVIWQTLLDGDFCTDIQQTADGGYIIVGNTQDAGSFDVDGYVVKLDAAGNREWSHMYAGGPTNSDNATSIAQTIDGGYIFTGLTTVPLASSSKIWVVKLDAAGNQTWSNAYSGITANIGLTIIEAFDNPGVAGGSTSGYIVSASKDYEDSFSMIKIDLSGNLLWEKIYGKGSAQSVHQSPDGGFVLAGWIDSQTSQYSLDYYIVKTDAGGNMQWNKEIYHPGQDEAYDVDLTSDGGYFVTGCGKNVITSGANDDYWVMKFDAAGNQVWARAYPKGRAYAGIQNDEGNFIIGGGKRETAYDDAWLLKLNSNGECPGCTF